MSRSKYIIFAIVAAFTLAACGSNDDADGATDAEATAAEETATEATQETDSAEETEEEAAPLFADKRITILVPFSAGSSPDITARIIAQELPQHLPGTPSIVVEPAEGGGGAIAMRQLASNGATDGTLLVVATSGILTRWLTGEEGHDYPLDEMKFLTAFPGSNITVVRSEVATSLEEAQNADDPLKAANTAIGSTFATNQLLAANLLDVRIRQIFGYAGPAEFAPALERGEADLATATDLTYINNFPPLVEAGTVTPIWQDGLLGETGEVVRGTIVSDVPTALEHYVEINGSEPPDADLDWSTYEAMIALNTIAIPVIAGQDTAPEFVDALRQAFVDVAQTDSWKEQMSRTFNASVEITGPQATQRAFETFTGMSDESLQYLLEISRE